MIQITPTDAVALGNATVIKLECISMPDFMQVEVFGVMNKTYIRKNIFMYFEREVYKS